MKTFAVIVAGGSGQRMGTDVPKQFLTLAGKPVIWHTINRFLKALPTIRIILVLPEAYLTMGHEMLVSSGYSSSLTLVAGGVNRFESVKNGLQAVSAGSIVMVHDGVRCLASPELILRCYETALMLGTAVPAINPADSIRTGSASGSKAVDRNEVFLIQTPQVFRSDYILAAFNQPYDPSFTDEATVVESTGIAINLVEGENTNIKITRPMDLIIAEQLLTVTS